MPTDLALLVFLKYPEPGKVKTRLAKSLGHERAAELYREFIASTLENCSRLARAACFATFTPAQKKTQLQAMYPGPWQWLEQSSSTNLGERIHHAINAVLAQGYRRVLAAGTDSPDLPLAFLEEAAEKLREHDLVLGPAEDGGYYLIGVKSAPQALFEKIDWSTERVLAQTLRNAKHLNWSVHLLPQWYDVDDERTLQRFLSSKGPRAA